MANGFFTDTTVCIGCKACEVACKQWNQLPADGYKLTGMSYDNTAALSATTWRHVAFIEQADGLQRLGGKGRSLPVMNMSKTGMSAGASPTDAADSSADSGSSVVNTKIAQSGGAPNLPFAQMLGGAIMPENNRWLMMSDVCKHCTNAGCLQACPTGAIIRNEFDDVYVQPDICNGCGYCVPSCPFGVVALSLDDGRAHKCTLCYDRQKDGIEPACAKACPTDSIVFGEIEDLKVRARKRVDDLKERGVETAYLYGVDEDTQVGDLNAFFLLIDKPEVYGLPQKPFLPQDKVYTGYATSLLAGAALLLAVGLSIRKKR